MKRFSLIGKSREVVPPFSMQRIITQLTSAAILCSALSIVAYAAVPQRCENLRSLNLERGNVTAAERIAAGAEPKYSRLPAFCRVAATLRPTSDSEIKIEVWMPEGSAWNGKYEGTGNGGWGGAISQGELAAAVERGYAAASTDTGHTGGSASFAMGHPEKLIDFGYRSIHLMTLTAKTLISAYYGAGPKLAYFQGCSSGGRQALMEAQRFPDDYDGIIAGSATNNWTPMMFGRIWVAQATLSDPARYIPPAKYPMIHAAVLKACDAMDGVRDGVIGDPMRCTFDPAVLACKDKADGPDCLTAAQVAAAKRIYAPATNPRTGAVIFPPMERGSELVWGRLAGGPQPIQLADDYFKYVIFEDPQWDFRTLNFDGDFAKAMQRDGGTLSATNPDLRPFFSRGGKLIQYHGWTDQQVMPENSINYYKRVVAAVGAAQVDESYRLFMAPGMNHCGGGDGPNTFDMLGALDAWRVDGNAPAEILASHSTAGKVDRTRPLCPYPQVARYKGSGSTDDAANFSCVVP
ncbi:MAG TPA: tannase/feruloyl esterase family alpha/beta hydrolase [Acidobacteriaceae bacterium]|nr:tannase/feruloyl esterase family alpha/beta hydrolase [Acidobacteriaceae bacterium]